MSKVIYKVTLTDEDGIVYDQVEITADNFNKNGIATVIVGMNGTLEV